MSKLRRMYHQLSLLKAIILLAILLTAISSFWQIIITPMLAQGGRHFEGEYETTLARRKILEEALAENAQYIYQDQIQTSSPESLVKGLAEKSNIPGVSLTSFKELGTEKISDNYSGLQFVNKELGAELVQQVYKKNFTLEVSGSFESIKKYVTQLGKANDGLYWTSLEYKVEVWPKATATLGGFVLRTEK